MGNIRDCPEINLREKKNILPNISEYASHNVTTFSCWFSLFFRVLYVYQCFITLRILFDEVDRGLGHENKTKQKKLLGTVDIAF